VVVCYERLKRSSRIIADCSNCYAQIECEIYIAYRRLEERLIELTGGKVNES